MRQRTPACCPMFLTWAVALLALVAFGCGAGNSTEATDAGTGGTTGDDPGGFESDDPSYNADGPSNGAVDGGTSGSAGSGGSSAGESGDEAERAIEEADIIQIDDSRLYALSEYSGLSIIDVSVRDQLRMLGRWRTNATPFEMIRRGEIVIAMFSSYPIWVWDEQSNSYSAQQTSRIVALDTSNPANITEVGSFDIPGEISDSRVVGDVFYVVSYENGYCYRCEESPTTTILSLDVSDPGNVAEVDREAFTEESGSYGWTRRSVAVTQDRMYVAGIEYDWETNTDNSTIQVIDISDPAGSMVLGAAVEVAGQIESRWQMDEHEGVLRVISQPGSAWGSGVMPAVETFTVVSSDEVTPLGQLEMELPRPENLRSVRFDGDRAFAVTFEQTDPLFTLDLSDPANPRQLGELEIPGWLYHMVPRGDRLIALGYDQGSTEGGMTVSLFDVADLSAPTMIDRVNFGGNWTQMAEDQDRIHKALNILDDEGLILVPYSGWDYGSGGCGAYESGIQLVDFTTDTLVKRGVAPQHGNARRAFLHDQRLFAVSDDAVSTFDIADRDAPAAKAELALSHNAVKAAVAGNHLVRIEGDWWTEEARLSVVPLDDPGRDQPVGSLDLSVLSQQQQSCYWSYWGFVYGSTLLTVGSHVVLIWNNDYYYYGEDGNTGVAVIDVSEPSDPVLVAHKTFDFEFGGYGGYYYGYYGYGYGSAVLTTGSAVVQHGSTVVLQQRPKYDYYDDDATPKPYKLRILDLSDPADPVLANTVELPDALGQTPLQLEGSVVLTSHWEPVAGKPGKVRFYVDRVDVSSPHAPQVLPSINVPGSLVARDPASGRIATVDYRREAFAASSYHDCHEDHGQDGGKWNWQDDTCVVMHRTIKLVDVQGSQATLRDELPIEDGDYGQVALGEDRIFLVRYGFYNYYGSEPGDPTDKLMTLSGFGDGELRLSDATPLSDDRYSWSTLIPYGTRVVAVGRHPGSVAVFDATEASEAPVLLRSEELVGNLYDVTLHGDTAICSLGNWGVQAVSLTD